MAEKVASYGPEPVPEGGIDVDSFLLGDDNRWTDGGRHTNVMGGIGSGDNADRAALAAQQTVHDTEPMRREASYQPQPGSSTPADDVATWQQRYGQETNEKGQWRRTAEEALGELQRLRSELNTLRNVAPQVQAGSPSAYVTQPNQAQQPDFKSMLPENFFAGKGPDDTVAVQDVNDVLRNVVGPAVLQLWHQQQALTKQQYDATKAASGITPQLENRLLAECPWLNNVAEGPSRVAAMVDILRRTQSSPTSAAQPAMVSPTQAAARRVTYVESGRQVADDGAKTVDQRMREEFFAAPTAAEKKAVLMKYGVNQVNDFRDPAIVTR